MRLVCDTNVLVSGILFGGTSRRILTAVSRNLHTLYSSPALLAELTTVLARPKFGLTKEQADAISNLFHETATIVHPSVPVHVVMDDPDDDRVLETAWAAQAEVIVSGDGHLLALQEWQGIRIMSPAEFCTEYLPETKQ